MVSLRRWVTRAKFLGLSGLGAYAEDPTPFSVNASAGEWEINVQGRRLLAPDPEPWWPETPTAGFEETGSAAAQYVEAVHLDEVFVESADFGPHFGGCCGAGTLSNMKMRPRPPPIPVIARRVGRFGEWPSSTSLNAASAGADGYRSFDGATTQDLDFDSVLNRYSSPGLSSVPWEASPVMTGAGLPHSPGNQSYKKGIDRQEPSEDGAVVGVAHNYSTPLSRSAR